MNDSAKRPTISPQLAALLDGLRRRIRSYIWTDGLAALVILLGAAFWVSLAFDWVFEPPAALRVLIIAAVAVSVVWVLYRLILRRAFVRMADRSMALVLERKFRSLDDSLLTIVELADHESPNQEFNPEMLARTERDALAGASEVRLGSVLNTRPLFRRVGYAALLVTSVVVFGMAASDAFGIWLRRSLLLSDELWPRNTRLVVEGFDDKPVLKVARGSDVELSARAEATPGRIVPEIVEVRYTSADGARVRENMSRLGEVSPGKDAFQPYGYTFKGVLAPIDFYVLGGDDRQGPYHLEVVDSPTVQQMTLHCEYPAYMQRTAREIPVTGIMPVPIGTRIVIRATANKDLVEAQVDELVTDQSPQVRKLKVDAARPREFEFEIDRLSFDTTLHLTLLDTDGIRSRDPVKLSLSAVADEAPEVAARLTGIGIAITPQARLPLSGRILDDYGIGEAWFEYRLDDGEPQRRKFANIAPGRTEQEVAEALDVEPLELKPQQKLHVVVQAADTYDLEDQPNVGSGQKYVLDVVTPEQLRSMLEARELQLRRRFEVIVQEFTDTRDLLTQIDLLPARPASTPAEGSPDADKAAEPADASAVPGAEPGDNQSRPAAEAREDESAEDQLARRKVQGARITQNTSRSADETRGLAEAFDDIRAELVNNRVDTEELKQRLKEGIADPLRTIADIQIPELLAELQKLESLLDQPDAAEPVRKAALARADAILVEMQQILEKMLELETFNEALDLLRAIIKQQEELNEQTRQRQKSQIRDLLED